MVSEEKISLNLLPNQRVFHFNPKTLEVLDLWDFSLAGTLVKEGGNSEKLKFNKNPLADGRLKRRMDLQGQTLVVRVSTQTPYYFLPSQVTQMRQVRFGF
jgi:hypothetical protein